MRRIFIRAGWLFDGEDVLSPATVVIEGDRIASVEADRGTGAGLAGTGVGREEPQQPRAGDLVIDASGRLVTPGLVNAHTHIYSALARGIALKDPAPSRFVEILERLWWRLDRVLELADLDLSATLHGVECLRSGVTTIFDHHASPGAVRGSLETIARAVGSLGLRACLCYEVSDRDGPETAAAGVEENAAFLAAAAADRSAKVRGLFGLHASFTVGDKTLRAAVEAAGDAGFHVHLEEDPCDAEITRERFGCGPVERLRRAGVLRPQTLCAHGVHLTGSEAALLAASGSRLVHCPESNMNNAVGAAALGPLQAAGVRLVLGTDGFTAAMVRTALSAQILQAHRAGDPREGYAVAPGLLFGANPGLAREVFDENLGHLRPGAPADLVAWDYRPPTPLTRENLWGHLAFGLVTARAHDVLIAGRRVLEGGQPVGVDEDWLVARCREKAALLWERF